MKRYIVDYDHRSEWNTENDPNDEKLWIITDEEIDRLAIEWGKSRDELLEQVTEA